MSRRNQSDKLAWKKGQVRPIIIQTPKKQTEVSPADSGQRPQKEQ